MAENNVDLLELPRKRGMEGDVDSLRVLVLGIIACPVPRHWGRRGVVADRRPVWGTQPGAWHQPQRLPQPRLGPPGGYDGIAHSQDSGRELLPQPAEPRRRSEKALVMVIQQDYVEGVSTRNVDDLIKSLGCDGISKSQVSRICRDLAGEVYAPGWFCRPHWARRL